MQNTHAINAKRYAPPFSLVVLASLDGDEKSKGRPFVGYHFRKHLHSACQDRISYSPRRFFISRRLIADRDISPVLQSKVDGQGPQVDQPQSSSCGEASRLLTRRATSQVPVCRAQRLLNMAFPKKAKIRAHLILVFSESCKNKS